jgi:two-component system LytT family response regulator
MIRVVIAEDEPLAITKLCDLIAQETDLELVGTAEDGAAAADIINKLKPDLAFLDVRMPVVTGIAALERLTHKPVLVFTTAYDQYALAAFELAAVDYLLKPFGQERFREAMTRVRRLLSAPEQAATIDRIGEALSRRPMTRLFVRDGAAIKPLAVQAIDRFEARDDYVSVVTQGKSYLLGVSLQKLEERLDPERFVRIHRSHIINLDRVKAIHAHDASRMVVEIADGARIVASKTGSQKLRQMVQPGT